MLWYKDMQLIDANVILRYILNDSPDMSRQVKKVVENRAHTKPEIIAEVVYVLKGIHQASREEIKVLYQHTAPFHTMLSTLQPLFVLLPYQDCFA